MKVSFPLVSAALLLQAHLVLGGRDRDHKTNEDALSLLRERTTPSEHKVQSAAATAKLSLRGKRVLGHGCPDGIDGYYCGNNPDVPSYLNLVPNRLYKCEDGDFSEDDWEDSCWNNNPVQYCKVNGGGHDECADACPDGKNGYYCGNNPDVPDYLVDDRLYKCIDGDYSEDDWEDSCWNNHPVQYCKVNGDGHDACVDKHPAPAPPPPPPSPTCPGNKDGYYCGNNPDVPDHLVDDRLYECDNGHYEKVDSCWNNDPVQSCKVNGGGHDECVDACPGGIDGYYCGNNPNVPSDLDLVDGRLYYCEDGDYSKHDWVDTCTNNPTELSYPNEYQICQVNGGGNDKCVDPTPTCPDGEDGYYCGNNPHVPDHLVDDRLYKCTNGHYERWDSCWNNHPVQFCKVNGGGNDDCVDAHPSPAPPPPSPAKCPGGKNGKYCGENPLVPDHLEDGILYTCEDGHYSHHIPCKDLDPAYCKYFVAARIH